MRITIPLKLPHISALGKSLKNVFFFINFAFDLKALEDAVKFTKSFAQAYWMMREPEGLLMFEVSMDESFKFSEILRNMPISITWDAKRIIFFLLI